MYSNDTRNSLKGAWTYLIPAPVKTIFYLYKAIKLFLVVNMINWTGFWYTIELDMPFLFPFETLIFKPDLNISYLEARIQTFMWES